MARRVQGAQIRETVAAAGTKRTAVILLQWRKAAIVWFAARFAAPAGTLKDEDAAPFRSQRSVEIALPLRSCEQGV